MIVFVSLFLGIVTGEQTIEVAVSQNVAEARILVDGELIQTLRKDPWRISHDLGSRLTTHELTAVALNDSGQEIGRTVQHLNVPRPRVAAEVLLEEWVEGTPTVARLVWHSAELVKPERVSVSVDGQELQTTDLNRIELPELSPDAVHFMTAEIPFPNQEVASAEVIFGGTYGSSVETEITAVPLVVTKRRIRSLEATRGWLQHINGAELQIVAVEDGPAEVAVVREDEAIGPLARIDAALRRARDFSYKKLRLERRDRLRFVSAKPSSAAHATIQYDIFPISRAFSPRDGALPGLLAGVVFTGDNTPAPRLTDAIAIAGRHVVQSQKRRAVVAVTSDCAHVGGRYSPEAVRSYLSELHVPLRVWQVARVARADRDKGLCRNAEEIYSAKKYSGAVRRLRAELGDQRMVWVQGRPLPREITLTAAARAVRLAGK